MNILRIRSHVCSSVLLSARKEESTVVMPIEYEGRDSYIDVLIEEIKPLNKKENSFFYRGKTVPNNGEKPVIINGTSGIFPAPNNHGFIAIYE